MLRPTYSLFIHIYIYGEPTIKKLNLQSSSKKAKYRIDTQPIKHNFQI